MPTIMRNSPNVSNTGLPVLATGMIPVPASTIPVAANNSNPVPTYNNVHQNRYLDERVPHTDQIMHATVGDR